MSRAQSTLRVTHVVNGTLGDFTKCKCVNVYNVK